VGEPHNKCTRRLTLKTLSLLTNTSVTPSIGSIGGGTTLTLTGAGFSSITSDANVVYVPVKVG
jgi:hypothetical protein